MRFGDRHSYRWIVFTGVAGIYFGFGVVATSLAPIVSEVRTDLSLSRSAVGLALGAWQFVYIATAPAAGRFVDRFGLKWSLTIGALVVILSGLARSAAGDLLSLWLAVALFGVGGPLISACAPTSAALWFEDPRERRLVVGAYTAAPAIGGIAVLVLSNSLLMPLTGSWRWTMIIETSSVVVALLLWLIVCVYSPQTGEVPKARRDVRRSWLDLLMDSEFRVVLVLGLAVFFLNHGLLGWMPEILREYRDFSAMAAANWVAIGGVGGVIASLTLPRFGDRRRLPAMLVVVSVVVAASLTALVVGPPPLIPLFVVLVGVRSAIVPLSILALMDSPSVSAQNMGTAYGLWFAVAEIGGVTGPFAIGRIGDTSAGFGGALMAMAIACGVVVLVACYLRASRGFTISSDHT